MTCVPPNCHLAIHTQTQTETEGYRMHSMADLKRRKDTHSPLDPISFILWCFEITPLSEKSWIRHGIRLFSCKAAQRRMDGT